MKRIFILLSILFFYHPGVCASYDPLSVDNNMYGIHVADIHDIEKAAELVNAGGGDWGYITVVIQEGQKHFDVWQNTFNMMRRKHLIPIIRIATGIQGESWSIPQKDQAEDWARFLDALNWPVQNRYIILFNEPNHAKEWGGKLDPEGYADIFMEYAHALKKKDQNFFILPAALDVSAPNSADTMDAFLYWDRVRGRDPDFFSRIDGWNSHSYPNPGFSAKPGRNGRGTLLSYQYEIDRLSQYGLDKLLPVFITETGWVHSEGKLNDPTLPDPEHIRDFIRFAAQNDWKGQHITAITPFVMNYQDVPFDHFSWKKYQSDEWHSFAIEYQEIPKNKGKPRQIENIRLTSNKIPKFLVSASSYQFPLTLENTGQSILNEDEYDIEVRFNPSALDIMTSTIPSVEPMNKKDITVTIQTKNLTGPAPFSFTVSKIQKSIETIQQDLFIIPPPSLAIKADVAWKKAMDTDKITVLIYDGDDILIHSYENQVMLNNVIFIDALPDIIPGDVYRVVILLAGYLPRQEFVKLSARRTDTEMKRLYPVDFNRDGAFTPLDAQAVLEYSPEQLFSLFF